MITIKKSLQTWTVIRPSKKRVLRFSRDQNQIWEVWWSQLQEQKQVNFFYVPFLCID